MLNYFWPEKYCKEGKKKKKTDYVVCVLSDPAVTGSGCV